MNLGPMELMIILGIVLLLFGARKLPEVARSLGRSTNEFKRGLREGDAPPRDESESEQPKEEQRPTTG